MKTYQLEELGVSFAAGPFGSSVSSKHFTQSGIPMIRGSNLSLDPGIRLIEDDLVYLATETVNKFPRAIARKGDLVFTCWGTIGQVGLISDTSIYSEYLVSNKQMRMTPDPQKVDSLFLYYYFSWPYVVQLIQSSARGSSVPGFNLGQLKSWSVTVPELSEQQAIAEVLGALDDKIAANEQVVVLTDELIRLEFYRLKSNTEESVELKEVARLVRTGVNPQECPEALYVGLEHVPRRQMFLAEAGVAADVDSTKTAFTQDDILFGKLRPYFHKVVAAPVFGICSTDIFVLRAKDELQGLLLAAASSDAVIGVVTAASSGTRMPRAAWKDLASFRVPSPKNQSVREFSRWVERLRDHANAVLAESRHLAALRDALLPELMSGRLTVRDAEKQVEEAL